GGFGRGLRKTFVPPDPPTHRDCPPLTSMVSRPPAERPPTTRGGTAAGSGGRTVSGSGLAPRTSCPARPHLADRHARGWKTGGALRCNCDGITPQKNLNYPARSGQQIGGKCV